MEEHKPLIRGGGQGYGNFRPEETKASQIRKILTHLW